MKTGTGYALITGASSGIGRALAFEFATHGHSLVLAARRRDLLEELASELTRNHQIDVRCLASDLTAPGAPAALQKELEEAGIQVEILVNNAGIGKAGPFSRYPLESDLGMIDLNVRVPLELCKRFLPGMVDRKSGRILNVASTAAFQPGPNLAVYYASKAFLLSFSEGLSRENRDTGVSITALCPGPTRTEFHARAGMLKSRAIHGRNLPPAAEVAAYGYRAVMRGKPVAVHGFLNRVLVTLLRLAPRSWVREVMHRIHAP